MKYFKGQRVVIISSVFLGVQGTFSHICPESGDAFAVWDDNGKLQKVPYNDIKPLSKFRENDIIEINGINIKVGSDTQFDESKAVLVSRRNLI